MAPIKKTKKYYFTVEGDTEQWYLKWLETLINTNETAVYKVSFDCPVQKNPVKRAKSLVTRNRVEIYHLSDYESDDAEHVKEFRETMDNMKKASQLGKEITYRFGYSNLTFDLWIVLHKQNCNASMTHRYQYLTHINRAFNEHFLNMDQYKVEQNFKRCLSKLDLSNVIDAVNRAKTIMKRNADNGYTLQQYKGYRYYKENPSLLIWEPIEKVLRDCGLMQLEKC